jgi:hypothetical protein
LQRRTAFDGSTGRGVREPLNESMDFRKIDMEGAPVQQRRIVPRGRGGEIRLIWRGARVVSARGVIRHGEEADPGLPLRALLL